MKRIKFLAFAAATFLTVSSVLYFNSCKTDPCKNVVCNNGGVCADGNCSCASGYEDATCSTEMRTKFLLTGSSFSDNGTTDSSYNNTTGHTYTLSTPYPMTIAKGTSATDIIITGLGSYTCNGSGTITVTATMASSTTFTIPQQTVCSYQVSGSGTLNSSGKVVITYVATYADGGHTGKTVTDHGTATQL